MIHVTSSRVTIIFGNHQVFNKLSEEELGVARSLGINETVMVKLMSNQQPKVERSVLQRFYLTLMLNDVWKGHSFWYLTFRP